MDNDTFDSLPEDELTDEERSILDAFDAADLDAAADTEEVAPFLPAAEAERVPDEDMQAIFVEEVAADCITLEQILGRRAVAERSTEDAAQGQIIQRIAHKLKGTCGAMHCTALAALALHTETLAKLIEQNAVAPQIGWQALDRSLHALEVTLEDFAASGQESPTFLATFEAECHSLGIDLHASLPALQTLPARELLAALPFMRVDLQRFDELLQHTERLATLGMALMEAQAGLESAFQELRAAEDRLRRLEIRLTNHLTLKGQRQDARQEDNEERSTSSLVDRILSEATRRTGRLVPRRAIFQARPEQSRETIDWDELEMDRFKEESMLALSFSEAIADVSIAASQLRIAFTQLTRLLREQQAQVIAVRDGSLLLSLTPLDMLLKRIEREMARENRNRLYPIPCEVTGETTEIDQEMVEQFTPILLQLIRACLATYVPLPSGETSVPPRMWLHVRAVGSAVLIEVGFSMDVAGGAFEEVVAGIRALDGAIEPRRNAQGGISYHLRLPRSRGTVHAVILRERGHTFAVPLSQVQHAMLAASARGRDKPLPLPDSPASPAAPVIALHELLALPAEPTGAAREAAAPAAIELVLAPDGHEESAPALPRIMVDEVIGDAALIAKPLPAHLQRPGIAGAAIDGANNVLLLLDVPELLRQRDRIHAARQRGEQSLPPAPAEPRPLTALIADDSVSIRQSLYHSLTHEGYKVFDARDGIQALELLQLHVPDALILDVEMPNLNGYDVLSMMRSYPELAGVKIVMLTSRFTDKHQARAKELGAHAYLTKPCDPETLLATLKRILTV